MMCWLGGAVLYPLGVTLDFWEEIAYYQLGWQIGDSHKAFLPVTFIGGHACGCYNSQFMPPLKKHLWDQGFMGNGKEVFDVGVLRHFGVTPPFT